MAQPRPVAGNTAATLSSIEALCDAVDAAAVQLSKLEQALADNQAAIGAEARARQGADSKEAQARADADTAAAQTFARDIAAEARARADGDTAEAQARADAIGQEQQVRAGAVSAAVKDLGSRIATLGDDLREALRAETQARTSADGGEQQARVEALRAETLARTSADGEEQQARVEAIRAQAKALADAVGRLEERIAHEAALADQALTKAIAAVRTVTDAIAATVTAQRLEFVPPLGRPGDAPLRYTFVMAAAALGRARAALPLVPAALIATGDSGAVVRISGSGILAARQAFALEPGRLYRARYVVQRRANPSDPTGDAVVCGLVYLDQALRVRGELVPVRSYPALVTVFGRQECEALVARSAGLGAAFQAPASARFAVPVVATFGPDALTDVEVLGFDDVTGAFVLAPPPDGLEARIADLVAGLATRVQMLEHAAGMPGKLSFGSKGDAAHAVIPDSVHVVELLGRRYAGDGGAGLYVRTSGDPPVGADVFASHGAVFQRVRPLPDIAAALIDAGFEAFVAGLPTEPPGASGQRWSDHGAPVVTP